MFINFYIFGPKYCFILYTPAVLQLRWNEYVMLCYVLVGCLLPLWQINIVIWYITDTRQRQKCNYTTDWSLFQSASSMSFIIIVYCTSKSILIDWWYYKEWNVFFKRCDTRTIVQYPYSTHIYHKTSINIAILSNAHITKPSDLKQLGLHAVQELLLFHSNNHVLHYCYDPLCFCLLFSRPLSFYLF